MSARKPRDYFVIMPFGRGARATTWRARFKNIIEAAVDAYEQNRPRKRAYSCTPMSERKESGSILDALARRLLTADIVIADISDGNANVCYELGVRHARRAGTILVSTQGSEKLFDLATEQIITYSPRSPGQAIEDIGAAIRACEADPGHPDSAALRAALSLEEPKVYAAWRQRNGRYRATIAGSWIERVDRGTPKKRDIHFSVFDFRFRPGLLHPFEMAGYSFTARGRLHSQWETKYIRVKRNEPREIALEYVYRAWTKNRSDGRPGYGQCRFLKDASGGFTFGEGFYFAGEENPPRRRDYELHRIDTELLRRLGIDRLQQSKEGLAKDIKRVARVLGVGPLQLSGKYAGWKPSRSVRGTRKT